MFYYVYVNLIRGLAVILAAAALFRRDYGKIMPAALALALTSLPWALSLLDVQVGGFAGALYVTVVFAAVLLGSAYKWYDHYPWWDRVVHFMAGAAFFGFGAALAAKAPGAGRAWTLAFAFALSLAVHEVWEVLEYLTDRALNTDHQRWQRVHPTVNHKSSKIRQPAGLVDTMNDAIAGIAGAAAACAGWLVFG